MFDNKCSQFWEFAEWLPHDAVLDYWCVEDDYCRRAKEMALITACENQIVTFREAAPMPFHRGIRELATKGDLLVERASFETWAVTIDGKSPLPPPNNSSRVQNNQLQTIMVLADIALGGLSGKQHTDAQALEALAAKYQKQLPVGSQTLAAWFKNGYDLYK